MAGSLLSKANLARIAKILALLFFVLPWVTVSCAEQTLATMSGVDLATGQVTMFNPVTNRTENPPGATGGDMLVVAAAALILAALAATFFLKGRNGFLAAIGGCALAAAALCYTVLVRIPGSARLDPAAALGGPPGGAGSMGPTPEEMAAMIRVETQIGFWLTILALIAAIALNVLAMRPAPPAAASAAPPPAV
jgi:hypothetical protein